jgi:hypothetical protein
MQELPAKLKNEAPYSLLWNLWDTARVAGRLPKRADLRLEEMSEVAGNLVLADWLNRNEVILRLTGSDVTTRVGRELTGLNLVAMVTDHRQDKAKDFYEKIVKRPCAGLAGFSVQYNNGVKGHRHGYYFPLETGGRTPGRLVGLTINAPEVAEKAGCVQGSLQEEYFETEFFRI